MSVLIFIISIIPATLIIIWMMKRKKEDVLYKKSCNSSLIRGLISVLPILAVSAVLFIFSAVIKKTLLDPANKLHALLYQLVYTFIVLAFAEELVKFLCFKGVLKKRYNAYSWADVVAFMVIIGTSFGLVEDIPYAIGASPMVMLVRGFTMGHTGYAFITGWFYGKKLYTGKKRYGVMAFGIPVFIHGLYDFSLSQELIDINDNFAAIGLSLALLDIILLVLMIRFFRTSRKKERYNTPLVEAQLPAA